MDTASIAESTCSGVSYLTQSVATLHSFESVNTVGSSDYNHRPVSPQSVNEAPPDSFQVLCQFDFSSEESAHISFTKGELLTVIKTSSTGSNGWWGATRRGKAGWIPKSYVIPVPDTMVQNLKNVRPELRLFELEVEENYRNATVRNLADPYQPDDEPKHPPPSQPRLPNILTDVQPRFNVPYDSPPITATFLSSSDNNPYDGYSPDDPDSDTESDTSPGTDISPVHNKIPPILVARQQANYSSLVNLSKPTPPTPVSLRPGDVTASRRLSDPIAVTLRDRVTAASPMSAYPRGVPRMLTPETDPEDVFLSEPNDDRRRQRGVSKVQRVLGGEADAYYHAKLAQTSLPWFIRPVHVGEEIRLEGDNVRAGTIEALIERLTMEPLQVRNESKFRRVFLMTFKSFTSSDKLLESLVAQYYSEPPPGLSSAEGRLWLEKKRIPTQKKILSVLLDWLEHYGMVEDDPHIVPRLQQFLSRINIESASQSLSAKNILQSLERVNTPQALTPILSPQKTPKTPKKDKWKQKNDILQVDPTDLAQQLTLYEYKLFAKIKPQECLASRKVQRGPAVANLATFCSTHDKIACWVKYSILSKEGLGRRADTVDRWIRIAEKCRHLNNISSCCAIVAALSSTVIERLHLTWAHVERRKDLQPLQKLAVPNNNFRECREVLRAIVTSCVPFIAMNLTDITHVDDKFLDNLLVPPSSDYPQGLTLINFTKRQATADVIDTILRHQLKPYQLVEKPQFTAFMEQQMSIGAKEDAWFWNKTQELQQAEVAHADIKRNLEAAGF